MEKQPELDTRRLILRPFEPDDAPEVQRLAGAPEIALTTLNIPHPYEDGIADAWIATHQLMYETGSGVAWAITSRRDGNLVGAVSLMDIRPRFRRAELGYWVGTPYWNKGYCTEAVKSVIAFGFENLSLIRIFATHLDRNPASGRVIQKAGMRFEGEMRNHVIKDGKPENLIIYGILRGDAAGCRG